MTTGKTPRKTPLKAGDRVKITPPHFDWQNDHEQICFVRQLYEGDRTDRVLVRNINKQTNAVLFKSRVSKYDNYK